MANKQRPSVRGIFCGGGGSRTRVYEIRAHTSTSLVALFSFATGNPEQRGIPVTSRCSLGPAYRRLLGCTTVYYDARSHLDGDRRGGRLTISGSAP